MKKPRVITQLRGYVPIREPAGLKLARDLGSKGIVSTDTNAHKLAVERMQNAKRRLAEQEFKEEELNARLDRLETGLNSLQGAVESLVQMLRGEK